MGDDSTLTRLEEGDELVDSSQEGPQEGPPDVSLLDVTTVAAGGTEFAQEILCN